MNDSGIPDGRPSPRASDSGEDSGSRRAALKKFGRYAAVAPTAMLLLDPHQVDAYAYDNGGKSKDKEKSKDEEKGKDKNK